MAGERTLAELAALVSGELDGDPSLEIRGLAALDGARPGDLSFVVSPRHVAAAQASRASAFIVPREVAVPGAAVIRVARPYVAVATLLHLFHPEPAAAPGIDATAVIAPTARVDPDACVCAFAVVGADSVVESRAVLHAHAVVGARCRVGADSVLHAHVVLQDDVQVGRSVIVHPGAVLGADGFGYAFDGQRHVKIPQVGRVIVEDDVEIGANVTIDRATLGDTIVGRGTKIDNLVQIGHNTVIGPDSIIVAQAGISGSSRLGSRVVLGGQVGVADHAVIGDGAQIASQSGVHGRVAPGAALLGTPAMPIQTARRVAAAMSRLPELLRTVRALERRVAELERRLLAGGEPRE